MRVLNRGWYRDRGSVTLVSGDLSEIPVVEASPASPLGPDRINLVSNRTSDGQISTINIVFRAHTSNSDIRFTLELTAKDIAFLAWKVMKDWSLSKIADLNTLFSNKEKPVARVKGREGKWAELFPGHNFGPAKPEPAPVWTDPLAPKSGFTAPKIN
jgi:hypothetical protein